MGKDDEGDENPDGIAESVELGEPEQEEANGEFRHSEYEDGLGTK